MKQRATTKLRILRRHLPSIVCINLQRKKNVKKSESHKDTGIDATSSSLVDKERQTTDEATRLSEDNDTISDIILAAEDIDVILSTGNTESLSAGSGEFVDIVSGRSNYNFVSSEHDNYRKEC